MYERVKDWSIPQGSVGEIFKAVIKTVFPIVNLDGASERLNEYDIPGAIFDLTTPRREAFLSEHSEAMQVTRDQARMKTPMSTDLAGLRAHHRDMSYDPFPVHTRLGSPNLDHRFPRTAALRAICALTAGLGLAD